MTLLTELARMVVLLAIVMEARGGTICSVAPGVCNGTVITNIL